MARYNKPNGDGPRTPLSSGDGDGGVAGTWGATDDDMVQPTPRTRQRRRRQPAQKPPQPELEEQAEEVVKDVLPTAQTGEVRHDSVLFVRGVLNEAIRRGASDIHFEPQRDSYRIRFRIDGVLQEFTERPGEEYLTTLNAVKVLSDLDIAERQVPQDGHLELVLQKVDQNVPIDTSGSQQEAQSEQDNDYPLDQYFDIRVSVFPSVNGQVIVMRILNRASALLTVQELGMEQQSLELIEEILLTSYGMILVTGPTGSGKTTTLYSILSELKSEDKNIMTLEDPIEFHLEWIRQSEIREEVGFTFERAMSSILRQDPDVLMVGEIRDPHTAEYAVRSALVGRIVGTTIHANTAIGTIARLLDLGIPRSILAHSINGIIAQRLVRVVCEHCKREYQPNTLALAYFGLQDSKGPFFEGAGCAECHNTGYHGRTGLFSVMRLDEELRSLIFDQRPLIEIQERAIELGMRTLKMDAAIKILAGITTAEEAARSV